jgi:alpha-L-arabinofuranosidase
MEGMVAGRRGRGRARRRWIQDVKETLNMSIDEWETWLETENLSDGF